MDSLDETPRLGLASSSQCETRANHPIYNKDSHEYDFAHPPPST